MRNLGKFNSDADIQNAINSGQLLNPYVAITGGNENYTFDYNKKTVKYSFGGFEVANGPLYYGSNGYEIKNNWNYDSYNSVYGKNVGSYYFSFIEMGKLFEKQGFNSSDMSIENVLDPLNGWRLPTKDELSTIIGISSSIRNGSLVNGIISHYCLIQITNVLHCGLSTIIGLLIFPDNLTITGIALANIDNTTVNTGITNEQLNVYLSQGCIFLPASGAYITGNNRWASGGTFGIYRTSSANYNGTEAYILTFVDGYLNYGSGNISNSNYNSVRLVKPIN